MEIEPSSIYIPVIIVASSGLLFAALIAVVAKVFRVDENPKIGEILNVLPGANCGACGKAGCSAYAKSIVENDAPINLCPPGGEETMHSIAALTGKEAGAHIKEYPRILCSGGVHALDEYNYVGVETCASAALTLQGQKFCKFGCLGFGDCVRACAFDAIVIGENGLPCIDEEKCVSCGACLKACPKKLVELHNEKHFVFVMCKSHDKGPIVRKICPKGCIGCGLCVRECPFDAIKLVNNLAVIDYDKCKHCGKCVKKCPTNVLVNLRFKNKPDKQNT